MKINPRYYPAIIIAAYVIFLLLGILLGFGPERGGEVHENSMLFQLALATLDEAKEKYAQENSGGEWGTW